LIPPLELKHRLNDHFQIRQPAVILISLRFPGAQVAKENCVFEHSPVAHGVGIFVVLVSLALGLQNGAFRQAGGITVHTTYLTGMITSLVSTEAEKYASEVVARAARVPDPRTGLFCGIWIAFVLGAGTGAAMVLHFKALGMLGAALLLIPLALRCAAKIKAFRPV
jgi:uncharacterized membrane protein YoaK (UPF0700 family)